MGDMVIKKKNEKSPIVGYLASWRKHSDPILESWEAETIVIMDSRLGDPDFVPVSSACQDKHMHALNT